MEPKGMAATPHNGISGAVIIGELLRNMEAGRFEMSYTVLLPCVFHVYLHPEDHSRLLGVFELVQEDAKRSLSARLAELNHRPLLSRARRNATNKDHKIAGKDWTIEFFADTDGVVPSGSLEIHSDLNELPTPGFHGERTTVIGRESTPEVTRILQIKENPKAEAFAVEIRYEDESGPQSYRMTQDDLSIGRGGDDASVDLPLYATEEVSREHCSIRRDRRTSLFFITDKSRNGTWVNGRRLARGIEERLPDRADIGIADVIKMSFDVKRTRAAQEITR